MEVTIREFILLTFFVLFPPTIPLSLVLYLAVTFLLKHQAFIQILVLLKQPLEKLQLPLQSVLFQPTLEVVLLQTNFQRIISFAFTLHS